MGTPKVVNEQDKAYEKEFFKKKEEENLKKAKEIFKSIERDLNGIKYLPINKKEEILQNVRDFANYSVYAFDFFIRSKNVD